MTYPSNQNSLEADSFLYTIFCHFNAYSGVNNMWNKLSKRRSQRAWADINKNSNNKNLWKTKFLHIQMVQ